MIFYPNNKIEIDGFLKFIVALLIKALNFIHFFFLPSKQKNKQINKMKEERKITKTGFFCQSINEFYKNAIGIHKKS
jgi:hypothetical protein